MQRHRPRRQLEARRRAAAERHAGLLQVRPQPGGAGDRLELPGQPLRAPRDGVERFAELPKDREGIHLAGEQCRRGPVERGERHLVETQRARERVAAQRRDEIGAADDDPGLGAAEQLVAREAHEVRAEPEPRRRVGLFGQAHASQVHERGAAEVLEQRQPVLASDRRQRGQLHVGREAADLEVAAVHLEQQRRVRSDRAPVVLGMRPIRRPDFDEPGAGRFDHVRQPERAADLDQLAPRDEDLAAAGQRLDRQHQRAGVVVDREGRFGAGEQRELAGDGIQPVAAATGREVQLQIPVVRRRARGRRGGRRRQQRATEIGMERDAGRIDDARRAGARQRAGAKQRRCAEFGDRWWRRGRAGRRAGASLRQRGANACGDGPRRQLRLPSANDRRQPLHGGKGSAGVGRNVLRHGPRPYTGARAATIVTPRGGRPLAVALGNPMGDRRSDFVDDFAGCRIRAPRT